MIIIIVLLIINKRITSKINETKFFINNLHQPIRTAAKILQVVWEELSWYDSKEKIFSEDKIIEIIQKILSQDLNGYDILFIDIDDILYEKSSLNTRSTLSKLRENGVNFDYFPNEKSVTKYKECWFYKVKKN